MSHNNESLLTRTNYGKTHRLRLRIEALDIKHIKIFLAKLRELFGHYLVLLFNNLPVKVKKLTLLRSPHVNKKAKDQLEIRSYGREFIIDLEHQEKDSIDLTRVVGEIQSWVILRTLSLKITLADLIVEKTGTKRFNFINIPSFNGLKNPKKKEKLFLTSETVVCDQNLSVQQEKKFFKKVDDSDFVQESSVDVQKVIEPSKSTKKVGKSRLVQDSGAKSEKWKKPVKKVGEEKSEDSSKSTKKVGENPLVQDLPVKSKKPKKSPQKVDEGDSPKKSISRSRKGRKSSNSTEKVDEKELVKELPLKPEKVKKSTNKVDEGHSPKKSPRKPRKPSNSFKKVDKEKSDQKSPVDPEKVKKSTNGFENKGNKK